MPHLRSTILLTLALLIGCGGGNTPTGGAPNMSSNLSVAQLKDKIEDNHPAAYYQLAGKLFEEGKKDEAVFWFYLGQLRYRFHLTVAKNLDPSGDPALFASFSEVIGRPINEYAFGDIPKLAKTIDEVLAWDAAHPNGFTAKNGNEAALEGIRKGLAGLKDHVIQNEASIKAERKANGL